MNFDGLDEEEELEIRQKYLILKIGEDTYGLSIGNVKELIRFPNTVPIPDTPDYIIGVTNLRSRVTPLIDMRLRLNIEKVEYTNRTVVVVLEREDLFCGIIVDEVLDVLHISDKAIEYVPKWNQGEETVVNKIARWDTDLCMILEVERFLEEAKLLQNNVAENT